MERRTCEKHGVLAAVLVFQGLRVPLHHEKHGRLRCCLTSPFQKTQGVFSGFTIPSYQWCYINKCVPPSPMPHGAPRLLSMTLLSSPRFLFVATLMPSCSQVRLSIDYFAWGRLLSDISETLVMSPESGFNQNRIIKHHKSMQLPEKTKSFV